MNTLNRCGRLMASAALAVVVGVSGADHVSAVTPEAGSIIHSPQGFIGCVDPGFTAGTVTKDYCFVLQRITTGVDAGSLSARAWTYSHTLPGTVLTDEEVTVPASALEVGTDGSFTLSLTLPQMGSVSLAGVGAGVHSSADQNEANTSFPLTYAAASGSSSLTPYHTGTGPSDLSSGTVAGERQVELQGVVWVGDACGQWQMAGAV